MTRQDGERSKGMMGRVWPVLVLAGVIAVGLVVEARPQHAEPVAVQAAGEETVVLLHGLGRTPRSMRPVEEALSANGYRVVNLGYPSRTHSVGELVDTLAAAVAACCGEGTGRIHFVTHSLGGILVRAFLATHELPGLGRVVMLSPPNRGSEVVDRLPEDLLEMLLGPAAVALGTDSSSVPTRLGPVNFELGVITGEVSLNPLFSLWLPGDDDGKVAVQSAWVDGTDDFLVVPYGHAFIMRRDEVIGQIVTFLRTGRFAEGGTFR